MAAKGYERSGHPPERLGNSSPKLLYALTNTVTYLRQRAHQLFARPRARLPIVFELNSLHSAAWNGPWDAYSFANLVCRLLLEKKNAANGQRARISHD